MRVIVNYLNNGVQKAEIIENVKGIIANDDGILFVNGYNNIRIAKELLTSFAIFEGKI